MIITVVSLDDFILRLSKATEILEDAVSVNVIRKPLSEATYEVLFQASAVVRVNETTEYLLQFGTKCGLDFEDQSQERDGSKTAQAMMIALQKAAEKQGYSTLPGVIGF